MIVLGADTHKRSHTRSPASSWRRARCWVTRRSRSARAGSRHCCSGREGSTATASGRWRRHAALQSRARQERPDRRDLGRARRAGRGNRDAADGGAGRARTRRIGQHKQQSSTAQQRQRRGRRHWATVPNDCPSTGAASLPQSCPATGGNSGRPRVDGAWARRVSNLDLSRVKHGVRGGVEPESTCKWATSGSVAGAWREARYGPIQPGLAQRMAQRRDPRARRRARARRPGRS